jgi:hypothetical protein
MIERSSGWARRTLGAYAFALACVVSIGLGSFLVTRDKTLRSDQVLSAIGLELIASVIFATIFALLSSRVRDRILYDALVEHANTMSAQVLERLANSDSHIPIATYPAGNSYDANFNRAISASLNGSHLYAFRGTSAKYVPSRLKAVHNRPEELRVVMIDPASTLALRRRAADRQRHPEERSHSVDTLANELKDEILMAVVALFDIREICNLDIAYSAETAVTRLELFDDSVFITWYQERNSTEAKFPETLQFRAGSFLYEIQRLDMIRRFDIAERKVSFSSSDGEHYLIEHLATLTGSAVSPEDVARWRGMYARFSEPFDSALAAF